MISNKRSIGNENIPATPKNTTYTFVDQTQPRTKRPRRYAQPFTAEEIQNKQCERAARDAAHADLESRLVAAQAEERDHLESRRRVEQVLGSVAAAGYDRLITFLTELLKVKDPARSSQVSRMLIKHGSDLLDLIRARQPGVAEEWAVKITGEILAEEGDRLERFLRPEPGQPLAKLLNNFSLQQLLSEAQRLAPNLCKLLRTVETTEKRGTQRERKDRDLVLISTICMLAQARNEQASEFQTTTGIYLLACGASRSQFDVLNHAGFCLSYTQTIAKVKQLGKERMKEIIGLARTHAFMIIWDNLNIAFRVGEQRKDSKDHFDNGTTATLIPLFGVDFGGLPLELKPKRTSRLPILKLRAADLTPSLVEVLQMEAAQLWHIEDILFDAYPLLRERFKDQITPAPSVRKIPLHKTEQYPLPTMHLDESSLEGTLAVLNDIICNSLELTGDGLQKHGIILCAGDQLSISLLDKVSACRRDDSELIDNVGRYTEGQLGLFHVKIAADRMVANEYWGKANGKAPWSLWKVNSLLGRKAISAGWKAKSLPPFRPTWELILTMALPGNVLDAFRIHCGSETVKEWVDSLESRDEIRVAATKILTELCSARRVEKIRRLPLPERDVPLENIILFNRDALILRELKYAIRRGDIGSVLNVLTYWRLMFRGTGKMPKYADALFHVLANLREMDDKLREAYLLNWLANLTGKENGFKEMDLLQEHQNFWAKIVYNARGSNRSWQWLAMVSVSIFILRDVIRRVQTEFKIPYNAKSHTSPSTEDDLHDLQKYLQDKKLQTYCPNRENNKHTLVARDLLAEGAQYANKTGAFKNFRGDSRKASNKGVPDEATVEIHGDDACEDPDDTADRLDHDLGAAVDVDFDDLAMDEEEFPPGSDLAEIVGMTEDFIDEWSRYD